MGEADGEDHEMDGEDREDREVDAMGGGPAGGRACGAASAAPGPPPAAPRARSPDPPPDPPDGRGLDAALRAAVAALGPPPAAPQARAEPGAGPGAASGRSPERGPEGLASRDPLGPLAPFVTTVAFAVDPFEPPPGRAAELAWRLAPGAAVAPDGLPAVPWLDRQYSRLSLFARACDPAGGVLAVNSNYRHAALPGEEGLLVAPPPPPADPALGVRRSQGDGSCFNNEVSFRIRIAERRVPPEKVYVVKFFPGAGKCQMPGVLLPGQEDGRAARAEWLRCVGRAYEAAGLPPPRVLREEVSMTNYRAAALLPPRHILVLEALHAALARLGARPAEFAALLDALLAAPPPRGPGQAGVRAALAQARAAAWVGRALVNNSSRLSFKIATGRRKPTHVNSFRGNFNILGVKSWEEGEAVRLVIGEILRRNWREAVRAPPLPDPAA